LANSLSLPSDPRRTNLANRIKGGKKLETSNQIRQLNQEEVKNLESFREDRKKDRTYIKFEDGETRTLKFDTMKRVKREPSEVYKDRINYVFSVIEPSISPDEKTWSVGPTVADQIYTELARGYTLLRITRNGLEKNTRYMIVRIQ
jgi:hypothetical protein